MKKEPAYKAKLDQLQRQERLKSLKIIGFLSFLFIFSCAIFFGYVSNVGSTIIVGKSITLEKGFSDYYKSKALMVVEIEGGKRVKASLSPNVGFQKNKNVRIMETKTRLGIIKKYKVIEYIQ